MAGKESAHGKAFEYSVACALANAAEAELVKDQAFANCQKCFEGLAENLQTNMQGAARETAKFLSKREKARVKNADAINIQPDRIGQLGDVRDVLLCRKDKILFGISAKHRHSAVKHSRLSDKIDFGKRWTGYPVSEKYWESVRKIFDTLRHNKERSGGTALFSDIKNKEETVYLPILAAFEDELKRLIRAHGETFCRKMFHYLVGKEDFYQVRAGNNVVHIKSFNLKGTLAWGKKWPMPTTASLERQGTKTLNVVFNRGWQVSFRLHNATSRIEPSLKFDIGFVGMSTEVGMQTLDFQTS